jgi:hypothetical protein
MDTIDELLTCPEDEFLNKAYQQVLGRQPDPHGMAHYRARLRIGSSRIEVLADLLASPEARTASRPGLDELRALITRTGADLKGWRKWLATPWTSSRRLALLERLMVGGLAKTPTTKALPARDQASYAELVTIRSALVRIEARLAELGHAPQPAPAQDDLDAATFQPTKLQRQQELQSIQGEMEDSREAIRRMMLERDDARREQEYLMLQLVQTQDELEATMKRLSDTSGVTSKLGSLELNHEPIQITFVRDTPPHCEIGLRLLRVTWEKRRIDFLDLKLVEHRGRPGIVLMGALDAASPLVRWVSNGCESGRPFLLIVPSDKPKVVESIASSDWLLLSAISRHVARWISIPDSGVSERWLLVAHRLVREIESLPPCLRQDSITIEGVARNDECLGVRLRFHNAQFGNGPRLDFTFDWRLTPKGSGSGASAKIELVGTNGAMRSLPPLLIWPFDTAGRLQSALQLNFIRRRVLVGTEEWMPNSDDRAMMICLLSSTSDLLMTNLSALGLHPAATEGLVRAAREAVQLLRRQSRRSLVARFASRFKLRAAQRPDSSQHVMLYRESPNAINTT